MTKKKIWPYLVPVIFFGILLITFYDQLGEFNEALPSPLIGEPMPSFDLTRLDDKNKKITHEALRGKIHILNVWASWCTTCEREHPFLMSLVGKPDVPSIVGLNYKDDRDAGLLWLQKKGNPYQLSIFDPEGSLGLDLGVYGVPETYLLDQNGIIRMKWVGKITPKVWQQNLLPAIRNLAKGGDAS